ncbi:MAG TPA: anti-sigma factor antagonist [Rhodospirillaceae bacterium]|nr:anti-anti-sigma factor [Candidatus Neomarinimicrobiota bacterium]HCX14561.1 anti-sigma factor antagonist [Rhodospirillaceae bacterium]
MTYKVRNLDGSAVVELTGDVDLQTSPNVRQQLLESLDANPCVIVDLSAVNYIDSSGVASLVEAFQVSRKKGSFFALANVSAAALRVLNLARLDKVFSIYPSVDAAIAAKE